MKNTQARKTGNHNANVFTLLFAAALLLLSGCQNPFQQSPASEAGTGFVSLSIAGQETAQRGATRAILPGTVRQGNFDRIDLEFTGNSGREERTWSAATPDNEQLVELAEGNWELVATAFSGADSVATGTAQFTVNRGETSSVPVALEPIPIGNGVFSWEISFFTDNIDSAKIEIRHFDTDTLHDTIDIYATRIGRLETVPAGIYRLIIRLYNNDGQSTVAREIMHVYRNMESRFTHIFDPNAFPVPMQYIILRTWNPALNTWNFAAHGIRAGHFDLLVNGVTEDNFNESAIIYWLNRLSLDFGAPNDLPGLKALVDAALIGLKSQESDFIRGLDFQNDYALRNAMQSAIAPPQGNGTPVTVGSEGSDILVTIGGVYVVRITPPEAGIILHLEDGHFGTVEVGYSPVQARTVTITNIGNVPTGNLTVALSPASGFELSRTSLPNIPVGETAQFTVRPSDNLPAGAYVATVTVSGAPDITPHSVMVTFTVTQAPHREIILDAMGTIDFGEVDIGYTDSDITPRSVRVTNVGNLPTGDLTVELSSANTGDFTLSRASIPSITSPGGTDTFTVEPNLGLSAGVYMAIVTVSGSSGITPRSFAVTFTVEAPPSEITLSVTGTYIFAPVEVDYAPIDPLQVTITNAGAAPTGNLAVELSGTNANAFALSRASIPSITSPGGTDTFTVVPDDGLPAGTYTAMVTISGDNITTPRSFAVTFTVNQPPLPGIILNATGTHNFGTVEVGYSNITPLAVTVTNASTIPTGALTVALSGTNAGNFALSRTSIPSITSPGETDTFTVVPNDGLPAGTYAATVTVSGDPSMTPRSFVVLFTVNPPPQPGIILNVTGTHNFGAVVEGYDPIAPLYVTVTNTSTVPTGNLAVALSGTNANAFALSSASIPSITSPGGTDTFAVVPNDGLPAGTYAATVTVSGTGITPRSFTVTFTVLPIPIHGIALDVTGIHNFGTANVGYLTVTPLPVTVTNTGNQPTGILTVALSSESTGDFTLSRTSIPTIISTGGTDTFTVAPRQGLTAGTHTATVTVSSLNPNLQSRSFNVSFTVIAVPAITLSVTGTLDFGTVEADYSNITPLAVTVTNVSTIPTGALTVALSGTNAGNFALSRDSIPSIIPANGTDTFTVAPRQGLTAGTHTATVTVSSPNPNLQSRSFNVSFTVIALCPGTCGCGNGNCGMPSCNCQIPTPPCTNTCGCINRNCGMPNCNCQIAPPPCTNTCGCINRNCGMPNCSCQITPPPCTNNCGCGNGNCGMTNCSCQTPQICPGSCGCGNGNCGMPNCSCQIAPPPCTNTCGCGNRNCGMPNCNCQIAPPPCNNNCGCGNRNCGMTNCNCQIVLPPCTNNCGCNQNCDMDDCACPIAPISVTVNPSSPSMAWGETLPFSATVMPAQAPQGVTWNIAAPIPANASISQAGVLTLGAVTPTVAVTTSSADVTRGNTHQFNANVAPAGATFTVRATATGHPAVFDEATVTVAGVSQSVTWSVNPAIAGVEIDSATGALMVAPDVAHGTTVTVRATMICGTADGETAVTIVYAPITSITIYPDFRDILPGTSQTFTVTVNPPGANDAIAWMIPTLPGATITIVGSTVTVTVPAGGDTISVNLTANPGSPIDAPSIVTLRDLTAPTAAAFNHLNLPGAASATGVHSATGNLALRPGESLTVSAGIQPPGTSSGHPAMWMITSPPKGVTVIHDGEAITVMATGTASPGKVILTATAANNAVSETITIEVTE